MVKPQCMWRLVRPDNARRSRHGIELSSGGDDRFLDTSGQCRCQPLQKVLTVSSHFG